MYRLHSNGAYWTAVFTHQGVTHRKSLGSKAAISKRSAQRLIDQLEWKGKAAYNASARVVWKVDGEVAGYMKGDVAGFSYVLATNCGHLVPTDQPKNALDLIRRFIKREPFA